MELTDLRIFYQVVSRGSITKAADELGYVQSNVTARIRNLESELNTRLLYRHPRGVTPTIAGNVLFEYSERIFSLVSETQAAIQNLQKPAGKIILGISQTISLAYHSALVRNILAEHPQVDVSVTVKHSDDLISAVANNMLDFALVSGPVYHPDLVELKVAQEELVLVSQANDKICDLNNLEKYTILLHEQPCAFRKALEYILSTSKINPTKILEYGTPESLLDGTIEGIGVSLLPLSAVKKHIESGILQATAIQRFPKPIMTVLIAKKEKLPSSQFDLLVNTLKMITGHTGEFL